MTSAAILLCAGEGTRMNDDRTHKVCYEIAGIPAVIRQINNFKKAGITRFVVVVGSKADKVMVCLDGIDGIVYTYQPVQNGTGSAALYGLKSLQSTGYSGPAIIAMGDKILAPDVIEGLIDKYNNSGKKAVFAVQPKEFNQNGGRVVITDNNICGIVEQTDSGMLALGALADKSKPSFENALQKFGINEKKRSKLVEKALNASSLPSSISLCGNEYTSVQIESMSYVNTATYIMDTETALEAISSIDNNNAQGEIYLTDAINRLAEKGDTEIFVVNEPQKILTYSTMDELLKLQQYFNGPKKTENLCTATDCLRKLEKWDDNLKKMFEEIYGSESDEFIQERRKAYIALINAFIQRYGDKEIVISRAPGRVNLMGRHIEHRGGSINVMSISKETLVVASPREDDIINISNMDKTFNDYSFSLLEMIKLCDTVNWINFIENDAILKMVVDSKGEWVNYVKAAMLRLQLQYNDKLLCGMDMMFSGNIPIAAGLSSSSSIVVSTAEAVIALNDMDVKTKDFIHLCGEGEWFVGSRGGAGDHAAMKCGKHGMITHLNFCPFEIDGSVEFPNEYSLVVANSFVKAKKSAGAKDLFNQKVACYEFGFFMVKKLFSQYAPKLQFFKDINPMHLQIPQSKIYEILLALPEKMSGDEIFNSLPEYKDQIKRIQKSHAIPDFYEIRSTMLYGISECLRAEKCMEMMKRDDFISLGTLMKISHNGDRVWKDGALYDYSASESYLDGLITDLKSEDIERVEKAQLYNQPGGYACSTKIIDELVDFINVQDGVIGSELSGAGLGGCILILVKNDCTEQLLTSLKSHYYDKNNLPMGAEVFKPVCGSGIVTIK